MNLQGEVNTQSVLFGIVQRLPMFLKIRWIHEVQNIRTRYRANPDVRQLVTFVQNTAFESTDPVYGCLLDDRDANCQDETASFPQKERYYVQRFHKLGSDLHLLVQLVVYAVVIYLPARVVILNYRLVPSPPRFWLETSAHGILSRYIFVRITTNKCLT